MKLIAYSNKFPEQTEILYTQRMQIALTNSIRRNRNGIILLTATLILLTYGAFLSYTTSQSQRFGDEVGHMVGGHFVLHGEVLYKDLQFNHQPLVYLYSAFIEKVTSPQNLYFYIARQREGVFVYGALWILLLIYFFRYRGFGFALIFELSKYFFQGNKLLAENLAVYPAVFLLFLIAQYLLEKKKASLTQLFIASIGIFIVTFSLFQMWFFVVATGATLLYLIRASRRKILAFVVPGLMLTGLLFMVVPITDYYRETITYVFQYFVPVLERNATLTSTILFPFSTLLPPYEGSPKIAMGVALFFLIVYVYLVSKKAHYSRVFFIVFLLWTANSRADAHWFNSFHLIPWFGGLIAVIISLSYFYLQHFTARKLHIFGHTFLLVLVGIWLLLEAPNPLTARKELMNDNYNNYSYSETVGSAIRIMKDDGDSALVIDNDPLIYWVGNVKNATHVLEYYSWILTVPQYRDELLAVFERNPPDFVVNMGFFDNNFDPKIARVDESITDMIGRHVKTKYVMVDHDNKSLVLYISKEKKSSLTDEQKKRLEDMLFYVPNQ